MSLEVVTVMHSEGVLTDAAREREELVRRVASSVTFEKSPRLRAFFLHVCRCARENKSEEATEPQIAIYVYGRQPGYNPTEDNIVRSQARVLRMKLEHHFANEGRNEPVVITIPKGQYLPVFEPRWKEARLEPLQPQPEPVHPGQRPNPRLETEPARPRRLIEFLIAGAALLVIALLWLAHHGIESKVPFSPVVSAPAASLSQLPQSPAQPTPTDQPPAFVSEDGAIRIAAGHTGPNYVDMWGRQWQSDHYYQGGTPKPGPVHFFPPVANEALYSSIREVVSDSKMSPQSQRQFRYDIPVLPGDYELRLYFADPLRQSDAGGTEDAQNDRHFDVDLNGRPLLENFDPIADGGSASVDIRAFKDVRAAADGKVHLEFRSNWERAFVSALELTRGTAGKLEPIRIAVRPSRFVDADGARWEGDRYFIDGRTFVYENPESGPRVPKLYSGERHGNFSYAIPVAPGSYTVRLHFLESFFSPLIPAANCHGAGCRVFDVTCNGVMLLENFDIIRAASGAFLPVVREFHGLHPNGQGKLLLSFSPTVNYAEVRAIEVIDEAR
jgi:hypothetical protein